MGASRAYISSNNFTFEILIFKPSVFLVLFQIRNVADFLNYGFQILVFDLPFGPCELPKKMGQINLAVLTFGPIQQYLNRLSFTASLYIIYSYQFI